MLAAFNIEKAHGVDGKPIEPNDEYSPNFVRYFLIFNEPARYADHNEELLGRLNADLYQDHRRWQR